MPSHLRIQGSLEAGGEARLGHHCGRPVHQVQVKAGLLVNLLLGLLHSCRLHMQVRAVAHISNASQAGPAASLQHGKQPADGDTVSSAHEYLESSKTH